MQNCEAYSYGIASNAMTSNLFEKAKCRGILIPSKSRSLFNIDLFQVAGSHYERRARGPPAWIKMAADPRAWIKMAAGSAELEPVSRNFR